MLNKDLTNILKTMKVNHVWNKDVLIRMLYSKTDVEHNVLVYG